MKHLNVAIIAFAGLLSTAALAGQDLNTQPQSIDAQHDRHSNEPATSNYENKKSADPKMKKEVQDDWREDAKERRDADVKRPEQR